MSSAVLTALTGHIARGRSASGRTGGARNTTSSNIDCHARFCTCFAAIYKFSFGSVIGCFGKPQQSYSCLRAVQFCTRLTGPHAASWRRGLFAIHVRDSSNCICTYRSRWGRATCLSDWAQGLNMECLRAQAPWRSHTQTPRATRKTARGWCLCGM